MKNQSWYLSLVLLVEGSALMAVELMGAKLLAPFYGSSLYVWTAVLAITVLGLTLGYFFGGRLAEKHATEKLLALILGVSALLVFAMPATAGGVISLTSAMSLIPGICTASLLLIVPPMFCFGLVGPMVVRLMASKLETLGNVAGTVYFTSTMGGIVATFLFGFYWIPEMGLRFSAHITALTLAALPIIFILRSVFNTKSSGFEVQGSGFEVSGSEFNVPGSEFNVQSSEFRVQSSKPETYLAGNPQPATRNPQRETRNAKPIIRNPKLITHNSKLITQNSIYLFAALEGAAVMAVELMAARMLAPYFGSSLYVWVAVIGITLLSLAIGYYFGGRIADKYTHLTTIHWTLLTASLFLMLMHYSAQHLTIAFMGLDMRLAVVMVSLLLILPPLLLLGMVPTLLIRFLTSKVEDAGATTGRVFTISSTSGILALPLFGFFVIPQFGLATPSILIGLLVGVVPFVKLISQKRYLSLFSLLMILLSFSQRKVVASSSGLNVLHFSEGLLGQVMVADVYKNGAGDKTNDRVLFVNRMGQTVMDNATRGTKLNYIIFTSAVASVLPENSKVLILGLGGGSAANIFHNLKFEVDAVEIDDRIANVSKEYFALSPGIKLIIDDGRHYLETTRKTYDLIFFDVFKGDVQPPHMLTIECFKKAKALLSKDGFFIINFNGFLTGEIGRPGRSVYATLKAAGLDTKILPTPGKEEERNTLFIASAGPQEFHGIRSPLLHSGKPVEIDSLFIKPSTEQQDGIVFTDDQSSLDRLNLLANNSWRKSYNASYARFSLDNGVPLFN